MRRATWLLAALAVSRIAVAVGVSAPAGVSAGAGVGIARADGATDGNTVEAPCRDRFLQPFSATSIWNVAIGSEASYVPAGLFTGADDLRGPCV